MSPPRRLEPTLLIADNPATRLGIRVSLEGFVQICAEAATAPEAIRLAKRKQPDVCLVGFDLPEGGLAAARGIRDAAPGAAIVIIANSADPDDLLAAADAGASGYLPGEINGNALRRAVSAVLVGEAAVPRSMVLTLMRALETKHAGAGEELSTREAQVLSMLARGQPTAAIAERLGISPVTVRRHISRTMHKTQARVRRALVGGGGGAPRPGSRR
jgi:DNA-binding NarL/FixJ family response regulator